MPKSLYGETVNRVPQIVFWQGTINTDGTPGPDYVEIRQTVADVESLLATMRLGQASADFQ